MTNPGAVVPGEFAESPHSPRPMVWWRRDERLTRLARILGAAGLVVAWLGLSTHFATAGFLIVPAAGALWLMATAVPSALLLAAARARLELAVAVVTVLAVAVVEMPLVIGNGAAAAGPQVRVFTANLRLGLAVAADVVTDAERGAADVVLLQELTPSERSRLQRAGLDRRYPFHIVDARATATGVGLWSRFPLSDAVRQPGFQFALVSARVEIPAASADPTLVSTHLVAPWPQQPTRWQSDLTRLKVLMGTLARTGPLIVGGDFNATYDNCQYRHLLTHGVRDAVEQSGAGLVPTFPAGHWYPPLIEIDHVLACGAVARSVHSVRVPGSDHRGLIVRLRLQAPSQ